MQNKHTPGPWLISTIQGADAIMVGADDGSDVVADIRNRDENDTDANARLIAAAPELLAALTQADDTLAWAQHFLNHADKRAIPETLAIIRAAIAKATGEE